MTGVEALASGSTPGGLPYPTMDDKLSETDTYIRQLRDAVTTRLASPGLVMQTVDVTTDSGGIAWFNFPQLSRLDGIIPQVLVKGTGLYFIMSSVISRNGNAAAVRFRSALLNTNAGQAATISNYVGVLTVCVYAWGAPA